MTSSESRSAGKQASGAPETAYLAIGMGAGVLMGLYLGAAAAIGGRGFDSPFFMIGLTLDPERVPFALGRGPTVAIGVFLHLATSVFWALRYRLGVQVLPPLERRWPAALLAGPLWGTVVWLLMGLVIGPTLNPALRLTYPLHYYLGHLVYGAATAILLVAHQQRERRS